MKSFLEPWHLLLLILAGWINHHQQNAVIPIHAFWTNCRNPSIF
jgi:hypothetical protein